MVYSSDIKDVISSLNCGTINYNVEAFYMIKFNGYEKLNYLKSKIKTGIDLTKNDTP